MTVASYQGRFPQEFHHVSVRESIQVQASIYASVCRTSGHLRRCRHVFGQPAKKEHGFENIKVTNSAWDTNIVSASGVSVLYCP
jgi:hypothetical protein